MGRRTVDMNEEGKRTQVERRHNFPPIHVTWFDVSCSSIPFQKQNVTTHCSEFLLSPGTHPAPVRSEFLSSTPQTTRPDRHRFASQETQSRLTTTATSVQQLALNELSPHMFWGRLHVVHPDSVTKVRHTSRGTSFVCYDARLAGSTHGALGSKPWAQSHICRRLKRDYRG